MNGHGLWETSNSKHLRAVIIITYNTTINVIIAQNVSSNNKKIINVLTLIIQRQEK